MANFFDSYAPPTEHNRVKYPRHYRYLDIFYDAELWVRKKIRSAMKRDIHGPRRRVLIVGVIAPNRENEMRDVVERLQASQHEVVVSLTPMGDRGKFANIDQAISNAPAPLETFDWLIITDDDITFAPGFLDDLIAVSEAANFKLAQPAHRFKSYAAFAVTRRHWGALARATRFVEIGPLTALHRDTFKDLAPFPPSRWCWGIDVYWSHVALHRGWTIGVCDATPIRHYRPVGGSYDSAGAYAEGRALLEAKGVDLSRDDVMTPNAIVLR